MFFFPVLMENYSTKNQCYQNSASQQNVNSFHNYSPLSASNPSNKNTVNAIKPPTKIPGLNFSIAINCPTTRAIKMYLLKSRKTFAKFSLCRFVNLIINLFIPHKMLLVKGLLLFTLLPFCLFTFSPSVYAEPTIVITEVLANALAYPDEYPEEFIELYNSTTYQINLAGWRLTDGDGLAEICPWNYSGLKNPYPVITGTTVIQPGQYAVVISTWYLTTQQRYVFPKDTLLLTTTIYSVSDDEILYEISLANSDPVTLFSVGGTTRGFVVSTFGMPKDDDNWKYRDVSTTSWLSDAGNGISWERINYGDGSYYDVDVATNWATSRALTGSTPGARNSVCPQETSKIAKTEKTIEVFNSPFFPHGDHPTKTSAKISYNVPKDSTITLKIFDTKGNLIITPIDQECLISNLNNSAAGLYCIEEKNRWKGTYYWNGRNENGDIVPVGVYICYIEAVDRSSGKVHKGKAGVVVGRKLD